MLNPCQNAQSNAKSTFQTANSPNQAVVLIKIKQPQPKSKGNYYVTFFILVHFI